MSTGDSYNLAGQRKVSDAEAREHEAKIYAKRIIDIGSNQTKRIAYDGSNRAEYVGTAPKGLAEGSAGWLLQKLTYDGASTRVISVKVAYGSWSGRAGYTYE